MSGYGGIDDEQQRAILYIEEQVEYTRSLLPSGVGTSKCIECGDLIPEARQKILPGVKHCVDCQSIRDQNKPTFKQPWAT